MNKVLPAVILFLWGVLLICICLLIVFSLLSVFVTIRNKRLLKDLYNNNSLSWFTEYGNYKSLRQRIQIGKERTRITKEFVNSENNDINNKTLFRFLMNSNDSIITLRKIIIILFACLLVLHIIVYIL